MKLNRFAKYAWGVLAFNLIVILWGVYVRATGSGAGCGGHWPLCNGEIIPLSPQSSTIIEYVHRLLSGLSLILVIGMFIWAFRAYPKGHHVRLGASLSMFFIITEALVGAGLVLFQWVAQNASIGRTISVSVHLTNTFLLLASIALTAWWITGGEPINLQGQGITLWVLGVGLMGVLALGISGTITALGDTLFPSSSLGEGLRQDFSPNVHFLIRLRVWHPVIAVIVGLYLLFAAGWLSKIRGDQLIKQFTLALVGLFILQLAAGLTNLVLLAPIWMQFVHLFLADMVWICLVLLSATTLVQRIPEKLSVIADQRAHNLS